MIRINLLPFRAARKKENVRRQISMFTLSIFLLTVGLFWYNSVLANQVTELEENVNNTRTDLIKYDKINKEIKALQAKLALMQQKIKVIEELAASREDAVRLLDMMTKVMVPGKMWLSSFAAQGGGVKLKGTAIDNKTVADFMTNLQNVEQFNNVNLEQTSQKVYKPNVFFKNFSINFSRSQMKPLEQDKAKK